MALRRLSSLTASLQRGSCALARSSGGNAADEAAWSLSERYDTNGFVRVMGPPGAYERGEDDSRRRAERCGAGSGSAAHALCRSVMPRGGDGSYSGAGGAGARSSGVLVPSVVSSCDCAPDAASGGTWSGR